MDFLSIILVCGSVGDPTYGFSAEHSFKTPPAVGPTSFPTIVSVFGDLGTTTNSSSTLAHLRKRLSVTHVINVGDYSYAGALPLVCI